MKEILDLTKALNAFPDGTRIVFGHEGIKVKQYNAEKKLVSSYKIKERPVTAENGIQTWSFVARKNV